MAWSDARRILLCDDDQGALDCVGKLLDSAGYSVSTAHDYREFMTRLTHDSPDLIILDVRMPERDGFWIAEALQVRGMHTPVIFLTGCDSSIYKLYAPFVGSVAYLLKPVDSDLLLQKVKHALGHPSVV
ncbi:MAG TPA: response regulator [Planctomycetota bacterium]|jgi:DNA-binding response OmpR family regulator